jgi:hypothetical protein
MSDELLRELNEIRLEEGINKKIFEHVVPDLWIVP